MSVEFWISTMKMTRNDFHFRFFLRFYFRFHFRPENEPEVEKSWKMIKDDVEIQNWIGEVKRHGFTYADDAEIPQVHGWHVFVDIFCQHFFASVLNVTQICSLIDIQTLTLVTVRNSESESQGWPYCNVKFKCQPPVHSQLTRLIKLNYCWLQLFLHLLFSTQVFSANKSDPIKGSTRTPGPGILVHGPLTYF